MNSPFLSVVIRSKDEADRLRLTLASLECQTSDSEVIVVDDGSSDHTAAVLSEAAGRLPLKVVRHPSARGRSAASNAGAREARGEVVLFLDGDTLAAPDLLSRHAAQHARAPQSVCRGDPHHLRCTRIFRDPDRGTPWPARIEEVARRPAAELDRLRVTHAQVLDDFGAIERRAEPGIYPGAGPRRLYELEMEALRSSPDCGVLWAASSGNNMSIRREDFLDAGGFDEMLDNNEHRELALRLMKRGARMLPIPDARSYHLTHRSGWRDPLKETDWEAIFLKSHPVPAVALLAVFWASLSPGLPIPAEYRINSLPDLDQAARGERDLDYDVARRAIGLPPLGAAFWRHAGETRSVAAARGAGS